MPSSMTPVAPSVRNPARENVRITAGDAQEHDGNRKEARRRARVTTQRRGDRDDQVEHQRQIVRIGRENAHVAADAVEAATPVERNSPDT